jgi:hypothetical protein
MTTERKSAIVSYPRLAFSIVLFAMAAWFAVTGRAQFNLGGDESGRRAIAVDAHGIDAVVIGLVFAGVGLLNLALGLRGRARLTVFWMGVAALASTMLYGLVKIVRAVMSLFG